VESFVGGKKINFGFFLFLFNDGFLAWMRISFAWNLCIDTVRFGQGRLAGL